MKRIAIDTVILAILVWAFTPEAKTIETTKVVRSSAVAELTNQEPRLAPEKTKECPTIEVAKESEVIEENQSYQSLGVPEELIQPIHSGSAVDQAIAFAEKMEFPMEGDYLEDTESDYAQCPLSEDQMPTKETSCLVLKKTLVLPDRSKVFKTIVNGETYHKRRQYEDGTSVSITANFKSRGYDTIVVHQNQVSKIIEFDEMGRVSRHSHMSHPYYVTVNRNQDGSIESGTITVEQEDGKKTIKVPLPKTL